ncbi:MAG: beta-CASP ribonuclease aCPSF1 [Crenarchaeota archaeon]|nr:beta-CASP ribonuclease aCPSF1 [Thermoproteota archaeon]MCR8471018.1 beta-CASP ribonuclease aCPSF1 [Thermoproteota archaeon]MCR8471834.1 beta-CASP ribonuclease aCPSF1 [Thermoproteota archaeon]
MTEEGALTAKEIIGYSERLLNAVKSELPPQAQVSDVRFEGPFIVVYCKNPEILIYYDELVKNIARKYKLRVIIRTDESVRKPEIEAEEVIYKIIPSDAGISLKPFFNPLTGQVFIKAKKPGLAIGKDGSLRKRILLETGWEPVIKRLPPVNSSIVDYVQEFDRIYYSYISKFLQKVGERIYRTYVLKKNKVRVTVLGSGLEVGGNAFLIETKESKVLIDAGMRLSSEEFFPYFDFLDSTLIDDLDAVVVTHAHLDHVGLVPYLYKYGYRGPVYCTEPTRYLSVLILRDYVKTAVSQGLLTPYSMSDIDEFIKHCITLDYDKVYDIAPDMRLTLYNAGHILGSALVHLHIAEGIHNIVFASDFRFSNTRLLDAATNVFPRVETIFMEATYGGEKDIHPPRHVAENQLVGLIKHAIRNRSKILIPSFAVGRAQELMITLWHIFVELKLVEPIDVYIAGMISEATNVHLACPSFLSRRIQHMILSKDSNPFLAEFFIPVDSPESIPEIANRPQPAIIISTNGMIQGGPILDFLRYMSEDPNNMLVFVSYQAPGTLGRQIQRGAQIVRLVSAEGTRELHIKMAVHSIKGFSGHSDHSELIKFVSEMQPNKPKRVVLIHGDPPKIYELAKKLSTLKFEVLTPGNGDAISLV